MRFVSSIFLLLTIIVKLLAAAKNNCMANTYKNDPTLLPKLNGYLYTLYTTVAYANNEIFKLDPAGNNSVYGRTTTDDTCCRTLNIVSTSNDHFMYDITSDKDCSIALIEASQLKLLDSNAESDGSCCILLWTCRKSRQGVLTLCDKATVSRKQKLWIRMQYGRMRLPLVEVKQTTDYKDGKCFEEKSV